MQVGVLLSKQLMAIAGQSLKANITTLAPLVLPVSEMVIFVAVLFARKVRAGACWPLCSLTLLAPASVNGLRERETKLVTCRV